MLPFPLHTILFLDIETVSQAPGFEVLTPEWKELWRRKAESLGRGQSSAAATATVLNAGSASTTAVPPPPPAPVPGPETLYERAGLYAEFGKIICISCGIVSGAGAQKRISLKSFYGDDEKELLIGFNDMLHRWATDRNRYLCAHNGKEFDFPYLCRRMIIQGLTIPSLLNLAGKKPWEIPHIDTLELWKFGDYKSFTSLNLLAHVLGIPTPKDDLDGSQVGRVYWEGHDLDRIAAYCQKDVVTVAQVWLSMHGETLISPENIEIK